MRHADIDDLIRRMAALRGDIVGLARRLGASRDDAQDIAQQTLLKAWQHIDQFHGGDDQAQLRKWLCTIARNCYYSLCRHAQANKARAERLYIDDQYPCAGVTCVELQQLLHRLPLLTDDQRDAFCAQAMGADYQTIAARTRVRLGTVKSRIARAREALSA